MDMTRVKIQSPPPSPPPQEKPKKRMQLSCFKCRERKVKCDQELPCESCVKHQCPETCQYDMSDGRRIPILTSRKLKEKEREVVELKAEQADHKGTIFALEAENRNLRAELAAKAHENARLNATCEQWRALISPAMTANGVVAGTALQMCPVPQNAASNGIMAANPTPHQTWGQSSLGYFDPEVFERPLVYPATQDDDPLTNAWNRKYKVNDQLQYTGQDEQGASISIKELVRILNDLPKEHELKISWSGHGIQVITASDDIQYFTLYCEVHSQIIDILSRVIEHHRQFKQDHSQLNIPDAIQNQLATSCLTLVAILEYYSRMRPCAVDQTDICERVIKAVRTIRCLEALSASITSPIYSQPASLLLQQMSSNGFQPLAASINDILRNPDVDQYNTVHPRCERSFYPPSNSKESATTALGQQQQQTCNAVIKQEPPAQQFPTESGSIAQALPNQQRVLQGSFPYRTKDLSLPPTWSRVDGLIVGVPQQMAGIASNAVVPPLTTQTSRPVNHHALGSFVSELAFGSHQMQPNTVQMPSTEAAFYNSTMSAPTLDMASMPQNSMQLSGSSNGMTKTAPSVFDSSHTASIYTPSSSSIHGSRPVSPVMGQTQLNVSGSRFQKYEFMHQGNQGDQHMWNGNGF